MALSNWDTLAVDHNNNFINGAIKSKMGVIVEIYKNWLYISDNVAWQNGSYAKPVVSEIHYGSLIYKDVFIYAKRGPQQGVYCIVHTPIYINKNEKPNLMVGIGCYGYDGDNWVGVRHESVDFLTEMLSSNLEDLPLEYKNIIENLDLRAALRFNQGDNYFANNLGFNSPSSKVGTAKEPVLTKIIKTKLQ